MSYRYDSDDSREFDTSSAHSGHGCKDEHRASHTRRHSPSDRYDPRDRYDRHRSSSPDKHNRRRPSPRDRYDRHRYRSADEDNRRRKSPQDRYDRDRSNSPGGHNRRRASPRDRHDRHRSCSPDEHDKKRSDPSNRYDSGQLHPSDRNSKDKPTVPDKRRHRDNNLPSESRPSKQLSTDKEDELSPSNKQNRKVNPSNDEFRDTPSLRHHTRRQSIDIDTQFLHDRYSGSTSSGRYDHPWDHNDLLNFAPRDLLGFAKTNNREENDRPMQAHHDNHTGKLTLKGGNIKIDMESALPLSNNQHLNNNSKVSEKTGKDDEPSVKKSNEDKLVYGQDENEERGNWSGKFDFILSMIGYAVGLGNIWRFPYLCYRNGGGAFLFPFLLMMATIGLPVFYLEAALGQFSSCGAMTCWQFAPLFKGLGISMVAVSGLTSVYYNMIIGWSLHYMFSSFTSDLPFASCNNKWNTPDCKLKLPVMTCEGEAKADDGRCLDENSKEVGLWNKTLFTEATGRSLQSPSQEYWERSVLSFSSGIDNYGFPKWDLVLCLMLAWIICFLCLIKGIKTTGKVVYFTALFPYVVLFILLIRGVTLENASIGIKYFITPDFTRLADAGVWKDAANQVFFSMSIAGGGLITLSSYNRFHNNILRDSIIVAVGDSGTCILGGFVIFSYLGYMAGQLQVNIEDVAADGAGLAFVVYPEAVSNLPPPTLWAILFFIMLLTLGLDSQFAMVETVLSGVLDQYPKCRPRKTLVILGICIILFILGLPLTCPGGMYLLQLMDNYVGGMTLIIIGFVEILALVFIYGVNRFCRDIQLMTGSTRFLFWKVTWRVLSPLVIAFIFVFMFVDYKPSTYDKYTYPTWADVIGWLMTLACVVAIPIVMIVKISGEREAKSIWQDAAVNTSILLPLLMSRQVLRSVVCHCFLNDCLQYQHVKTSTTGSAAKLVTAVYRTWKIRLLCLPTVYWGPALKKHRELVNYVEGFQVDPYKNLQPRAVFVNYAFDNYPEASLKSDNQASLGASRVSIISAASKCTTATTKSGMTYESNV